MFRFWCFSVVFMVSLPLTLSAESVDHPDTEMQNFLILIDKSDIDGLMHVVDSLDEKYVTTH